MAWLAERRVGGIKELLDALPFTVGGPGAGLTATAEVWLGQSHRPYHGVVYRLPPLPPTSQDSN